MVFSESMKTNISKGREIFSEAIKRKLYLNDNNVFETIDFYNETIFKDPLLFALVTQRDWSGAIPNEILANWIEKEEVEIKSDEGGLIYIPHFGYFSTLTPNTSFLWKKNSRQLIDKESHCDFRPIQNVTGTNIELYQQIQDPFMRLFNNWNVKFSKREHSVNLSSNFGKDCGLFINNAFEALKISSPEYYDQCLESTRSIQLFKNPEIPGFVSREAHGAIFLSVGSEISLPFFLDEIVHQSGHNIFNLVTHTIQNHIKIDPRTPLRTVINRDNITNTTIEGAYHGLFTVCSGIQVLGSVLQHQDLSDSDRHELTGRLGVKGRRFRSWTKEIDLTKYFTEEALDIINILEYNAEKTMEHFPEYFNEYDFSNQPYVFSYKKFKEIN